MANRLNVVIGADINELKKGFDEAIKVVQSSGTKMSGSIAEAAKDIQSRLDALSSKRPTARVVRELQTLAMEARNLGPEFSGMADKFVMAAGKMQDEIGDTRAQIGYFASDTRRLDAVLGGAQAIAAGFGVVQGSMAAMGVESEDLQKTMAKLQGVMVLLNSLQALHATLLQDSALKTGVMTLANNALTAATTAASTAMGRFKIVLAATGIGALAIGVGILVDMLSKLKTSSQLAAEATEKQTAALKQLADQINENNSYLEINQSVEEARLKSIGASEAEIRAQKKKTLEAEIANLNAVLKGYEEASKSEIYALNASNKRGEEYNKARQEINSKYAEMAKQTQLDIAKYEAQILIDQYDAVTAANKKREEEEKKAAEKRKKIIEDQTPIVTGMFDNYQGVFDIKPKTLKVTPNKFELGATPAELVIPATIKPEVNLQKLIKDLNFQAAMTSTMEEINKQFEQMLESITTSFGEALGNLLSGQDGAFQNFGKQALTTIAEFMKMVGQALIATAIASDAFKKLLLTQPLAAAAAGVALVAGATIIKNKLEKGPEFTAFADGGIVSGPTFALMGEYPNARTNPEVIAPLDKLQKLIGTSSQGSGDSFIASTRISGRDLSIVLERYKQDNSRG